jgi:DnaJ-class molecular chaperone
MKFLFLLLCQSIILLIKADKEYYKVIGVAQSASLQEIKKAYRKLSAIYHPDHCRDETVDCTDKMAQINVAYEVLSDQEKRKKYD